MVRRQMKNSFCAYVQQQQQQQKVQQKNGLQFKCDGWMSCAIIINIKRMGARTKQQKPAKTGGTYPNWTVAMVMRVCNGNNVDLMAKQKQKCVREVDCWNL